MTTLAARSHIPSNVADLSNRMSLFLLTKGDGTPFDASSILEEDIIEICIQFGHTHPEDVLWYSAIESVMLFHTMDKLQIVACGVVKASMLCDEAIKVRTSPASATHVRAYMAVANKEPPSSQPLPSDREEESHLSPSNPYPGGRTPQHLQANLGDLMDNELHREIGLLEMNMPPRNPPQTPWWNPMGNGDPDADDWEVTFLRRGGWVSPEQPFWPPAPAHPDGRWEPRRQSPHPQHLFNLMRM